MLDGARLGRRHHSVGVIDALGSRAMLESLTGFVVVGLAIAVGYVIGRIDLLGEHARPVLARLTFFVLSPFLLFVVLAAGGRADAVLGTAAGVGDRRGRRDRDLRRSSRASPGAAPSARSMIGALSAGQVNSNNIGIPLSLYLLGSAAYPGARDPAAAAGVHADLDGGARGGDRRVARSFWRAVGRALSQPDRDRLRARHGGLRQRHRASADRVRAGAADRERLRSGAADQLRDLAATASACSAHRVGAATSSWRRR